MKYIQIPIDLYLDLLRDRFEFCKSIGLVGEAEEALFPQLLDLIDEVGIDPDNADPSYVVDNYCGNGEFISREDFEENPDWYPSYEDWDDIRENALVSNSKYACMQF